MIEYSNMRERAFGREVRTQDDVLEYIAAVSGKSVEEVRAAREASERRGEQAPLEREPSPIKPELRSDPKGLTFDGYATTYDNWYPIFGGPSAGGFNERIARGATDKSASEADVVFLLDHGNSGSGMPIARTRAHTLDLESDSIGLRSVIPAVDKIRNPDARYMVDVMEDGSADQMSFAFHALRQQWNDDYTERTITEVKLYDVSLVTFPANGNTSAVLRSADEPPEQKPEGKPATGRSLALAKRIAEASKSRRP